MATCTLNKQFAYNDDVFFGIALKDWVDKVHAYMSKQYQWTPYRPLQPGAFGFDNIAMSVGFVFSRHPKFSSSVASQQHPIDVLDLVSIAEHVHDGWCANYVFWRDAAEIDETRYKRPYSPLGDERRNLCAVTPYNNLPDDEKEKDLTIAKCLLEHFDATDATSTSNNTTN